jgi:hypothetical protein
MSTFQPLTIILVAGVDQEGDAYSSVFHDSPDGRQEAKDYWTDKKGLSYAEPQAWECRFDPDGTVHYKPLELDQ